MQHNAHHIDLCYPSDGKSNDENNPAAREGETLHKDDNNNDHKKIIFMAMALPTKRAKKSLSDGVIPCMACKVIERDDDKEDALLAKMSELLKDDPLGLN